MLRDQADGAAIPQRLGLSAVLGETHARYPGGAYSARLRHVVRLEVTAGNVPAQIRWDGTSGIRRTVRGSCRVAHRLGSDAELFSSCVCLADLQYVDGLRELAGAPGAAAQLT